MRREREIRTAGLLRISNDTLDLRLRFDGFSTVRAGLSIVELQNRQSLTLRIDRSIQFLRSFKLRRDADL